MKKLLFVLLSVLALVACKNDNEPQQPGTPSDDVIPQDTIPQKPEFFAIALSYDSVANTVTALPFDTTVEYALQIWMKQDFILDYGDDFSDEHIAESLQSYIDMCIEWQMLFPTFVGVATMDVYEFFDQSYPGEEFIAMAVPFNMQTRKIEGKVDYIFFTTPE